jgi:ABC-type uncharacterized transport system permease subunit
MFILISLNSIQIHETVQKNESILKQNLKVYIEKLFYKRALLFVLIFMNNINNIIIKHTTLLNYSIYFKYTRNFDKSNCF